MRVRVIIHYKELQNALNMWPFVKSSWDFSVSLTEKKKKKTPTLKMQFCNSFKMLAIRRLLLIIRFLLVRRNQSLIIDTGRQKLGVN